MKPSYHFFMRRPKLVFAVSAREDRAVALAFRNLTAGGVNFRELGLLLPHPELRKRARLTSRVLRAYGDRYSRLHRADFDRARRRFVFEWERIERPFFRLVRELFGFEFPPGTYTCYVSMWNCNPRDIRHRSFQIFFRHIHPRETMVHELLHFAFYAYAFRRFPRLRAVADDSKQLWEISEAFNTVVLNSPRWRKILRLRRDPAYPELRGLVRAMRRQWAGGKPIGAWLDTFFGKK